MSGCLAFIVKPVGEIYIFASGHSFTGRTHWLPSIDRPQGRPLHRSGARIERFIRESCARRPRQFMVKPAGSAASTAITSTTQPSGTPRCGLTRRREGCEGAPSPPEGAAHSCKEIVWGHQVSAYVITAKKPFPSKQGLLVDPQTLYFPESPC